MTGWRRGWGLGHEVVYVLTGEVSGEAPKGLRSRACSKMATSCTRTPCAIRSDREMAGTVGGVVSCRSASSRD